MKAAPAKIVPEVYPRGDTYYHVSVGHIGCANINLVAGGYVVHGCRTIHPTIESAASAGITRRMKGLRSDAANLEYALSLPFDNRSGE